MPQVDRIPTRLTFKSFFCSRIKHTEIIKSHLRWSELDNIS